jgi:anti-sigma B factor antagonist
MELRSQIKDNVQILSLSGSFDTYTNSQARQWLEQAAKQPPAYIVVDLSKVQFLDSTALYTLVHGMKRSREAGGDMHLCGLQQPVRMIFELTRLDRVFEIFQNQEEAVQAFWS